MIGIGSSYTRWDATCRQVRGGTESQKIFCTKVFRSVAGDSIETEVRRGTDSHRYLALRSCVTAVAGDSCACIPVTVQ
jgi:hypothetical protein